MPRDARAERNIRFFREVNDRIRELEGRWVSGEPIGFVCECAELGCCAPVYLTVPEFLEVRRTAGCFAARPDHVDPASDRVVLATDRYVVVAPVAAPSDAAEPAVRAP